MNRSDANHPDVVVGELTLFGGQRQGDAAHMALLTPPRRAHGDRRSETLLIFLDLGGGGASGLARAMLEHFDRVFWRCPGPVTTALRQAIGAANSHLREENRLMPVGQRRRGGLICAALRGDQVYLSQLGAGRALLMRDGAVLLYPAKADDRLPLGVSSGIDVHFSHSEIGGCDRLLLTGENWMGAMPVRAFADAMGAEGVGDVLLALEQEAGDRSISVIVVECCPVQTAPEPAPEEDSAESAPADGTAERALSQQEPLTPLVGAFPFAKPVAETRDETLQPTQAVSTYAATPSATQPPDEITQPALVGAAHPDEFNQIPVESPEHMWPNSTLAPSLETPVGMGYIDVTSKPDKQGRDWSPARPLVGLSIGRERLDRSRQGLRRVGAVFTASARSALKRVLPEPDPTLRRPSRHAKDPTADNVPMMSGIAVAIPVLVAFLVVTLYLQRGEIERQATVVNQAHQSFEAAKMAQGDEALALLATALQDVDAALIISPEDDEILAMRAHILDRLDELETVVRPALFSVWDYGRGQGRRLAATRTQLFVLDTIQGKVYQQTLDQTGQSAEGEEPTPVADSAQIVGDVAVGGLRDLLWLSASGPWTGDALLLLTEDNRLLQHSLSWGLSWVPFNAEEVEGSIRALRPYDGKIYALDAEQDQIWRYPYNGDGFDAAQQYFNVPVPDLSAALDMTIDGAIYVLLEDGQIYKFVGGGPEPFQINGLPQPLSNPVALVSEGDMTGGALYVADIDNQSIVALTKDGEFIHQIKASGDTFADLEALAVDEDSRILFVLANGRLYALALPSVPEQALELD